MRGEGSREEADSMLAAATVMSRKRRRKKLRFLRARAAVIFGCDYHSGAWMIIITEEFRGDEIRRLGGKLPKVEASGRLWLLSLILPQLTLLLW